MSMSAQLFVVIVDQIDAAADPPASLVVQLDDVRKQRLTLRKWPCDVLGK